MMRVVGIAFLLAAASPAPALAQRPHVPPMSQEVLKGQLDKGEELETRVDGDLNGDGEIDVAFVSRKDDDRKLHVMLAFRGEYDMGHDPAGVATLDSYPLGEAALSVRKGVLMVEDLTGGTSATSSTYRYRWDPAAKRMRLIGIDAKFYSRTNQHGWNSVSWNLLTGDYVEESAELRGAGENASYAAPIAKRSKRAIKPRFMEDAPGGESLVMPGEG